MIKRIMVNLDVVEALLFFWHTVKDRNKVSELFIFDVMGMPGFKYVYDDEFTPESVRRALSAVANRESFSARNKKEGRFYSNNLWMLEDLNFTESMIQPLKKLNLNSLVENINANRSSEYFGELEVCFSPFHYEEYLIKDTKLIINFFAVKMLNGQAYVGKKKLLWYIEEKILELID